MNHLVTLLMMSGILKGWVYFVSKTLPFEKTKSVSQFIAFLVDPANDHRFASRPGLSRFLYGLVKHARTRTGGVGICCFQEF